MNTLAKTVGAISMAGTAALLAVSPSVADPWYGYSDRPYFYHHYRPEYHRSYDPGFGVTAGFIGGIFGAIAGTALSAGGGGHVWRCEHTYRSYVPATDTYTGYDGHQYLCRL